MCETVWNTFTYYYKMFPEVILVLSIFSGLCTSDFVSTPNQNYFLSIESLNWTDAREACINASLELVSVLSNKERDTIQTFLKENNLKPADKWSGYWLAGIRYPNGTFYWDTTETEVGLGVQYGWLFGEPSNADALEHCLELKWDGNNFGWNDYHCIVEKRYLCQNRRKDGSDTNGLEDYSFLTEENLRNSYRDRFYYHVRSPVVVGIRNSF
ncbi:perlucin-like [Sitophilus oryzae]|uniref:Perlucin-like n=1 Tax=Sitophilus oryzae TaxID=7048 RepID=A0A6J2XLD1_SITOR|nr:perlucin-like [Sitophilus oryzae]